MVVKLLRSLLSIRNGRLGWLLLGAAPILTIVGGSWWLTAPLEPTSVRSDARQTVRVKATPLQGKVKATPPQDNESLPPWPEHRLEGTAAKELLLATLIRVHNEFKKVEGYTATFYKQERLRGKLGPEQTLAMKVRERPFAVYFKFLAPVAGKEVVYAEGYRDNKIIAHSTGVSRLLVPRLSVPPNHPLALADSRHPVTEAGLGNLIDRLVGFRRKDANDPSASTILDRTTDHAGKPCLRSIHLHEHKTPERPFARVEVLYDPESRVPVRISNYDWPEPDHQGDLLLAERYTYENVNTHASLSNLDFDPANPAYAFHRY